MSDIGITALLPIYNGAKYLPDLMKTLSKICDPEDEILVISDGSTDETNEMILGWARIDDRVHPIVQNNKGLVATLNIGVEKASHDWVARFDVDDTYAENRLMIQRAHIQEGVAAIFSDYGFQSNSHRSMGRVPSAITPMGVVASLSTGNRTAHPSVIFNKNIALNAGGYRQEDFKAEDLALWIRMSALGNLISVPDLLLNYTLTKNSITRSNLDDSRTARDRVLASYVTEVNLDNIWNSYETTKHKYSEIDLGGLRLLLHLLDLSRIAVRKGSSHGIKSEIRQEVLKISANPQLALTVGKLVLEKILRKIYLAT